MADFAGTVSLVSLKAPFAGHPGELIVKIALSGTTYASAVVNISGIAGKLSGIRPEMIKGGVAQVGGSSNAYMSVFEVAAAPVWTNIGNLKLFTATAAEATGSLTLNVYLILKLHGPNTGRV